jgi:2-polyprenyl-3-methyl-5-hydroxy-6-metoxy-1,4-benzoquinol methylase
MATTSADALPGLEARARATLGASSDAIYRAVIEALEARAVRGGTFVDVGCGRGDLFRQLHGRFDRYVGIDAVRYEALPDSVEFHAVDLDVAEWPPCDLQADVVAAVETIEHLENPWAFVRALVRLTRPGGWIVVTTPNQLSALSLLTLLTRRRFSAFQDAMYPMHRTALLPNDLARAMTAAGVSDVDVAFTHHGRVPMTPWHYPAALSRACPRACSDNVLAIGAVRMRDRGASS